jgi:hypothetical protein
MSTPTDLSDFTLKQLMHLYQLSEAEQSGHAAKDLNNELLSDQDVDLFSKIIANGQQGAKANKDNHLGEIFDSLIDDIDPIL